MLEVPVGLDGEGGGWGGEGLGGQGGRIVEGGLGGRGGMVIVEGTGGKGGTIVEGAPGGRGRVVIVEEPGGQGGGTGVGEPGGKGEMMVGGGPEGGGSRLGVPVGIGGPGIVTELVSEPTVLEVIVESPLVTDVRLDVRLVSAVDPAEEETSELGWLTLVLDGVEVTSVELGRTELLVDILGAGGLLGGKGTGTTTEVLLELGRGTELDRVVSVDHTLDVWLDIVGDGLELELCPCGMTIVVVVGEGSAVNVVEDGLTPLVLETVELP